MLSGIRYRCTYQSITFQVRPCLSVVFANLCWPDLMKMTCPTAPYITVPASTLDWGLQLGSVASRPLKRGASWLPARFPLAVWLHRRSSPREHWKWSRLYPLKLYQVPFVAIELLDNCSSYLHADQRPGFFLKRLYTWLPCSLQWKCCKHTRCAVLLTAQYVHFRSFRRQRGVRAHLSVDKLERTS